MKKGSSQLKAKCPKCGRMIATTKPGTRHNPELRLLYYHAPCGNRVYVTKRAVAQPF